MSHARRHPTPILSDTGLGFAGDDRSVQVELRGTRREEQQEQEWRDERELDEGCTVFVPLAIPMPHWLLRYGTASTARPSSHLYGLPVGRQGSVLGSWLPG